VFSVLLTTLTLGFVIAGITAYGWIGMLTYYLLSVSDTYEDVQSGLMCKMCFIIAFLLSIFEIL
jgi:hypothetical protein